MTNKFEELGMGKGLLDAIKALGFEEPTPIQEETIPHILKGKDIIGKAATGSGKTLAFGAGIITKVQKGKGIQALVMTPTRELAEQVAKELKKFSTQHHLEIVEVYGGASINPQITRLQRADVVVGTPGRILDHMKRRTLNLKQVEILVLDEADRMVDMGFLPDVEKIINQCPTRRQTLMFSATISPDIDYVSKKYMTHAKLIEVKSYVDASKLKQTFYDVPDHEKFSLFVHLLKHDNSKLVMVFCNTRGNVDHLVRNLKDLGLEAAGIHGGMNQAKRNKVLEDFHKQNSHILICTDVAARGLDIKNVSHVYNYDIPKSSNDYIHRIGRTARAGKEGEAVSIVSSRDYMSFRAVLSDDSIKIPQAPLPEFEKVRVNFSRREEDYGDKRRGFGGQGRGNRRYGTYGTGGPRRGGSGGGGGGRRDSGRSFGGRREGGSSSYGRREGGSSGGYRREGSSQGSSYGRRDSGSSGGRSFGGRREGGSGGGRSFGGRSGSSSGGGRRFDSRGSRADSRSKSRDSRRPPRSWN